MTRRTGLSVGILAILIISLCLYFFRKHIHWTELAAIGTILAVIWAVYAQVILAWMIRPILKIVGPYEPEPPYFRAVPLRLSGKLVAIKYKLTLQLKNTGGKIANKAQPHISGMARFEAGEWKPQNNWIAAAIRWDLDVPAEIGGELPTEEKNLVPHRPYPFTLGAFRTDAPDIFILNTTLMPGNQLREYPPGKFCFKCEITAEGTKPIEEYYCIEWKAGCTADPERFKAITKVYWQDHPPWEQLSAFRRVKKQIKGLF